MSEELKLKPCPFCGSAAKIFNRTPTKRPRWEVICASPSCTANIGGGLGSPKKDAIAYWNRRAPEPRASDELFGRAIKASYEEGIEKGRESVKSESGTSVIHWTRYDGTPETLPRKHITVFLIRNGMEEIIFSRLDSDGDWMERQIAYDKHVGDLWAYLPVPPEGM